MLRVLQADLLPRQSVAAQIPFWVKKAVVQVGGDAKLVIYNKQAHIVAVKFPIAGCVALGYEERLPEFVVFPKHTAGAVVKFLPLVRFLLAIRLPKGNCRKSANERRHK